MRALFLLKFCGQLCFADLAVFVAISPVLACLQACTFVLPSLYKESVHMCILTELMMNIQVVLWLESCLRGTWLFTLLVVSCNYLRSVQISFTYIHYLIWETVGHLCECSERPRKRVLLINSFQAIEQLSNISVGHVNVLWFESYLVTCMAFHMLVIVLVMSCDQKISTFSLLRHPSLAYTLRIIMYETF